MVDLAKSVKLNILIGSLSGLNFTAWTGRMNHSGVDTLDRIFKKTKNKKERLTNQSLPGCLACRLILFKEFVKMVCSNVCSQLLSLNWCSLLASRDLCKFVK